MNGIVINIDPVIFHIGGFELRWYALAIIVAVLVAVAFSLREAKRKGLSADDIYSLVPWVMVAGIVGARLFHVVDQWHYYAANPLQIFQFQQGGLAIWGALVGGSAATIIYALVKKISIGRLFDVLIPGLIMAQIVGRFGCIINGDAYGGMTTLPWGFIYIHPNALISANLRGVSTHPYPVYEILWNTLVLLLILRIRHRFAKDGMLLLMYLSFYSIGRLALSFVRQETTVFWGLQQAQFLALVVLIISVALFSYLLWQTKSRPRPVSG